MGRKKKNNDITTEIIQPQPKQNPIVNLKTENEKLIPYYVFASRKDLKPKCKNIIKKYNDKEGIKELRNLILENTSKNTSIYDFILKIYSDCDWNIIFNKVKELFQNDSEV